VRAVPRTAVRSPVAPLVLGAALGIASLNLRTPVTAVGPVLDDIRRDLGLSGTAAGLLTMLPLLCFGAIAPVTPRLTRRRAPEMVFLGCLAVLTLGVLIRLEPSVAALFAGTVVLGSAIAIANVLVPAIIKRDFERPGTMMGVYAVALGAAGALGAGLSVPFEHLANGSWRIGLGLWALPAAAAVLLWLPVARRERGHAAGRSDPVGPPVSLWRDHRAWMISGFMGCQALLFYAFAAWLPDILKAHGESSGTAGLLLSIALVIGIPGSLLVPIAAERMRDQRPLAVLAAGLWAISIAGLLVAPDQGEILWVVLLGFGQGAGIALALALFALRAPDGRHAAALSGMAQSVGYLVAAFGPLAVGALHDVSGGWTAPLCLLLVASLVMLGFGLAGAGPGWVGEAPD
jgi:MFS transporter, CP family, cyanate transporter